MSVLADLIDLSEMIEGPKGVVLMNLIHFCSETWIEQVTCTRLCSSLRCVEFAGAAVSNKRARSPMDIEKRPGKPASSSKKASLQGMCLKLQSNSLMICRISFVSFSIRKTFSARSQRSVGHYTKKTKDPTNF